MSARTAVFVGPSLDADAVRRSLPDARLEPPIARGDLARLRSEGADTFLIIDGVFAHRLAVAPSEIVRALRDGARVIGASSMGAIRAAECWPAGMEGVGAIHRLYRLRVVNDDDEVAVATSPDNGFAAVSVALINVRFAVLAALRRALIGRRDARAVLATAKALHFSERHWVSILRSAGVEPSPGLLDLCAATDVKRRDAALAVGHLAQHRPSPRGHVKEPTDPPAIKPRYVGHDPHFGYPSDALRRDVTRWLLASGRYRRYVSPEDRTAADPDTAAALWSALAEGQGLDAELMRWHAVRRGWAIDGESSAALGLPDARQSIAAEHGYADWTHLLSQVRAGHLHGIPLEWIDEASRSLALARRNLRTTGNAR